MARERHKVDEVITKNHVEIQPIQKQKVPIVESTPQKQQVEKEPGTALIIGNELKNLDPVSIYSSFLPFNTFRLSSSSSISLTSSLQDIGLLFPYPSHSVLCC